MTSKKTNPPEMAQVDRNESPTSFWRPSSRTAQSYDGRKVIGASYSHADILNLQQLNISGGSRSRPQTPPSVPNGRESSIAASRAVPSSRFTPTYNQPSAYQPRPYQTLLRQSSREELHDDEEDSDEDGAATINFDDDEDEFGLPSITSMRRKGRRNKLQKSKDPPAGSGGGSYSIAPFGSSPTFGSSLRNVSSAPTTTTAPTSMYSLDSLQTNSGDIAEERGIPSYPVAKKSEGKFLRPQYKEILRDPANSLHLVNHASLPVHATQKELDLQSSRITRINKFKRILQSSTISLPELKSLAWSGIPVEVRAMTWQLLLGYLPTSSERRVATLERKRKEYLEGVRQAFEKGTMGNDRPTAGGLAGAAASPSSVRGRGRGLDEAIWHQISIDVPRTNPHIELYGYEATQRSLERILYVWAIRHPASGYVQGINDLVTPFWQVFLGAYISDPDVESGMDPGQLPRPVIDAVEADTFWCLTKLLDGIQDNYIHAQPGIQRQVAGLRDLTTRIDATLAKHLESENVEFIQFSFRWINCLLMREMSVKNITRMWDTYLSEDRGFSDFHLYVCAAFLVKWSDQLVKMDFQEVMMFLQSLPTKGWTEKDVELLLSEAFIWQQLFRGSSAHLRGQGASVGGRRAEGMLG